MFANSALFIEGFFWGGRDFLLFFLAKHFFGGQFFVLLLAKLFFVKLFLANFGVTFFGGGSTLIGEA